MILDALVSVLFLSLGIVIFIFLFWRRLREDYDGEQIFTSCFFILFGIVAGYGFSRIVLSQWWFWTALVGSFLGLLLSFLKFGFKFTESLEAWVLANLGLIVPILVLGWLRSGNGELGFLLLAVVVLILTYYIIDNNYRRFSWYKSGKVGFSGLTILGMFFLIRAVIALVFPDVLSFVGKVDFYISAILSFVVFLAVFRLSKV